MGKGEVCKANFEDRAEHTRAKCDCEAEGACDRQQTGSCAPCREDHLPAIRRPDELLEHLTAAPAWLFDCKSSG